MKLINVDTYARIKGYLFAKVFQNAKEAEEKTTAKQFMKTLKQSLPKEMRLDTTLVE